jgi:uncharacterized SAM-binding protein YcdF (DUF218 family)
MRDAWRGRAVELVVESSARVTSENAARTLPLLVERGVERAVVVCAPLHLFRARLFFSRVYASAGIATRFRVARVPPSPRSLAWELVALSVTRAQLRAARAEVAWLAARTLERGRGAVASLVHDEDAEAREAEREDRKRA